MQVHDELVLEVPDAELARVIKSELPGLHDPRGGTRGAAGRGRGRRAELGTGALMRGTRRVGRA